MLKIRRTSIHPSGVGAALVAQEGEAKASRALKITFCSPVVGSSDHTQGGGASCRAGLEDRATALRLEDEKPRKDFASNLERSAP